MPELPEVETVRLQLLDKVVGHTITGVEVFHAKTVGYDEEFEGALMGKTFCHIERIGKLLIFSFANENDVFLLAHLKMTGQFFFVSASVGDDRQEIVTGGGHSMSDNDIKEFPGRHTRVAIYFDSGATLYFNDMRLFGYLRVVN